jgi:hypothetical protein
MPTISEFFGIAISMYYNDHAPPHFHAEYAEDEVVIRIDSLSVRSGGVPPRSLAMVREWAAQHREELLVDWDLARRGLPLRRIAPLK